MTIMKYDIRLKEPNKKNVIDVVDKVLEEEKFFKINNDILNKLFKKHNKNDDFEKVLLKVAALNTLYSSGVKNIHINNMAEHIVSVYGEKKYKDNPCLTNNPLESNDHCIKFVEKLAKLLVEEKKDEKIIKKELRYISFASKFCFFQNNGFFFILDSYVIESLFELKEKFKDEYQTKFGNDFIDFTKYNLRQNYKRFYIAINQFITLFGLQTQDELPILTNRQIDIYLWAYGREIKKAVKEQKEK